MRVRETYLYVRVGKGPQSVRGVTGRG